MSPTLPGGTAADPDLRTPAGMTMRPPRMVIAGPRLAGRLAVAADALQDVSAEAPYERLRRDATQLRTAVHEDEATRRVAGDLVVYRLESGGHRQTGVVMEVAVADYRRGRVRRHEDTRPDRRQRLTETLAATGLDLVPVTLLHRPRPRLQALLAQATTQPPHGHTDSGDGVTETVWVLPAGTLTQAILSELENIDALYIADGHHRMAAAEEHATRHHRQDTDAAADYALCALFPGDEMRVFGYHRSLPRPPGVTASELVDLLAEQPATRDITACRGAEPTPGPGRVAMWLDGRWYDVTLSPPPAANAHAALDVVALEEGVLAPALQRLGVPAERGVAALAGAEGADLVAGWCAEHDAVGFLLHPPTIDDIVAVSDAGHVMPPKSTWFDPKARPGLFLRDLSAPL
jgi:uncharacterized protein (DUF1015 family)